MTGEELQDVAKRQVSVLHYNDDNKVAAINGFVLGVNYVSVAIHDIVSSPNFTKLVKEHSTFVNNQNVDKLKDALKKQTDLSSKSIDSYVEFLSIFFKNCYESGIEFALENVHKLLAIE